MNWCRVPVQPPGGLARASICFFFPADFEKGKRKEEKAQKRDQHHSLSHGGRGARAPA